MYLHSLNPVNPSRIQKPNLCAAGCVQSEADKRLIKYGHSIEDLGNTLKVYINEEDKDMFMIPLSKRGLPITDARVGLLYANFKTPKLQKILRQSLGLEVLVKDAEEFFTEEELTAIKSLDEKTKEKLESVDINMALRNAEDFLIDNIEKNRGIMMNFWNYPFRQTKDGHYVMIIAYDEDKKVIYVMDPHPNTASYWHHELKDFLPAMLPIWEEPPHGPSRDRGFVIFDGPMGPKENSKIIDELIKNTPRYKPYKPPIEKGVAEKEQLNPISSNP